MAIDVNNTYYDHFAIFKSIESLCCTTDINIISYFNYTSIKKNVNGDIENMKGDKRIEFLM